MIKHAFVFGFKCAFACRCENLGDGSPLVSVLLQNRRRAVLGLVPSCLNIIVILTFVLRAAEQLIGLPDSTPDEEQQAAESDLAQQQQQQGGGTDVWLQGRVAFATSLMDVGETRVLGWVERRETWSTPSCQDAVLSRLFFRVFCPIRGSRGWRYRGVLLSPSVAVVSVRCLCYPPPAGIFLTVGRQPTDHPSHEEIQP